MAAVLPPHSHVTTKCPGQAVPPELLPPPTVAWLAGSLRRPRDMSARLPLYQTLYRKAEPRDLAVQDSSRMVPSIGFSPTGHSGPHAPGGLGLLGGPLLSAIPGDVIDSANKVLASHWRGGLRVPALDLASDVICATQCLPLVMA